MGKFPETETAGRGRSKEIVTVTFAGTAEIHRQVPGKPWWSTSDTVTCSHKHPDWESAEACGARLGQREARRRNREHAERYAGRPCDYRAADTSEGRTFREEGPQFIKWCAAHDTAAFSPYSLQPTAEAALALDWSCPWEEVNR